jgi:2-keto-4-pentenoate hydratase/2-oxohepta-3-ene-1,7-dioic acid hydratase in catechol pathway
VNIGRFTGPDGEMFWGVISGDGRTVTTLPAPFAEWSGALALAAQAPAAFLGPVREFGKLKLRAPLEPGARIFGVGMNYRSHLERLGATAPKSPAAYIKPESAIVDPYGEIRYPSTTQQLDYEVELVLVVGGPVIPGRPALASLLGYTAGNDVSPRDVERQTGGPDLYSMKAQDQTAPIGPWVGTMGGHGGVAQPSLTIWSAVNGERRQTAETSDMLFSLDDILRYVNTRNALRAGDLIFTGTTGGVGLEDGRFLKPGDVVEVAVDGIGSCRNTVGEQRPAAD